MRTLNTCGQIASRCMNKAPVAGDSEQQAGPCPISGEQYGPVTISHLLLLGQPRAARRRTRGRQPTYRGLTRLHRTWGSLCESMGQKRHMSPKTYLECVPSAASAGCRVGTHRSRAFCALGGQSVSRLDAVLEMELPQTRHRARASTEGVTSEAWWSVRPEAAVVTHLRYRPVHGDSAGDRHGAHTRLVDTTRSGSASPWSSGVCRRQDHACSSRV